MAAPAAAPQSLDVPVASPPPSVRKRFAFTIASNVFRSALSFATGLLVARWMGPSTYGNMAFLLGTFVGLRMLLDLGTSTAFFTFLSQRPRTRAFVRTYYAWLAIQFLLPLLVMGLLMPSPWVNEIWRGQPRALVLVAFAAAFMQNSAWPALQQVGEAQRRTLVVQSIGVVVVAIHLAAVVLLLLIGRLGIFAVLAAVAIEYLAASIVAHRMLVFPDGADRGPEDAIGTQLRRYGRYCLPMVPYAAVSFAQEFADRWLLQRFGGAVQQAYYAVASQFAIIGLLATQSILRIFWKEVAEAHHRSDHRRAYQLYRRVSRVLFFVGAMAAGFLVPWSSDLLTRLLGTAYAGGALTLSIMFLYPVHQSMGQIGSAALFATERVGLQSATGIVTMTAAVAVSYVVLAPAGAPFHGLGLGSEGLAIKMVLVQIVSVNVIAYFVGRTWGQPLDWVYQPVSLFGCLAMGWVASASARFLVSGAVPLAVSMCVAGVFYAGFLMAFLYLFPGMAGLSRVELISDLRKGIGVTRAALSFRGSSRQ